MDVKPKPCYMMNTLALSKEFDVFFWLYAQTQFDYEILWVLVQTNKLLDYSDTLTNGQPRVGLQYKRRSQYISHL